MVTGASSSIKSHNTRNTQIHNNDKVKVYEIIGDDNLEIKPHYMYSNIHYWKISYLVKPTVTDTLISPKLRRENSIENESLSS